MRIFAVRSCLGTVRRLKSIARELDAVENWNPDETLQEVVLQEETAENAGEETGWKPIPREVPLAQANHPSPQPAPSGRGGFGLDDIVEAGAFPGFALSYHGRNQRQLKERFAALYQPLFRDQPTPPGSGSRDRPRIGILVTG